MSLFCLQLRQVKETINHLQLECYISHLKYSSCNVVVYSDSVCLMKLYAIVVLPQTIRSFYAFVFSKSDFFVKNSCYVLGLPEFKDIINKPRRSAVRKPFSSMRVCTDCRIRNIPNNSWVHLEIYTATLSSSHYSWWFLYLYFLSKLMWNGSNF